MTVTIHPSSLRGSITPPPSKSQGHRLLLCAALATGESRILRLGTSEDIEATLSCLSALGASFQREGDDVTVTGRGGKVTTTDQLPLLDCGESGSTLRFLIPIALAVAGGGVFTGRGRLMERPQQPYIDLFAQRGIRWQQEGNRLRVQGRLTPGEYTLPGDVSSQFFTGLLYALPLLERNSRIVSSTKSIESLGYISMTQEAQSMFGVTSQRQGLSFPVPGGQGYRPCTATVEPDWSQAAFWYAATGVGNDIAVEGMNLLSLQGDRVIAEHSFQFDASPANRTLSLTHCPDLAPPLAVWAALRPGCTRLTGGARLRIKESDRLASIATVLTALGAEVTESADSLTIIGRETLPGGVTVDAHNDHRIAMMTAIAASRCHQPVTLTGAESVAKSYPHFWADYEALGGKLTRNED